MTEREIKQKRQKEQKVVEKMIRIYCQKKHKRREKEENGLCQECDALRNYAQMRSEKCPHMENKTFCSNCKTHCYEVKKREKIREIMRFSGPRMLWHHPILCIEHGVLTWQSRRKS